MENEVYLLLGSNLGDRNENLERAKIGIAHTAALILNSSSLYETQPWGKTDQPGFINQVIQVACDSTPRELLTRLLALEAEMGRLRKEQWGPRLIDMDILFFGQQIVSDHDLTIPHPGISERRFTLVPLAEIAPGFVHPLLKKTCQQLLAECQDPLGVTLVL